MGKYVVYSINIEGINRYIGHTNNKDRRLKEHMSLCYKIDKPFYKFIKDNYEMDEGIRLIKNGFTVLYSYGKRVDAKRREMFLILDDYFNKKELYNKVPNISDR
jgi:hypothetical protein